MWRHSVLGILIVTATSACGGQQPALPTSPTSLPLSVPAPPSAPEPGRHVSGLVLDSRDTPIPGAKLTFNAFDGPVIAMSDAVGRFDVTVNAWIGGLAAWVEKEGYERSLIWISTRQRTEVSQNLRLHQPVYAAADGTIRLSIKTDDPFCGFDLEYHCRRVQLTTPRAGTITARVIAEREDTLVGLALSSEFIPRLTAQPLTINVAANSVTLVDVLVWWTTSYDVPLTLTTSFAPR